MTGELEDPPRLAHRVAAAGKGLTGPLLTDDPHASSGWGRLRFHPAREWDSVYLEVLVLHLRPDVSSLPLELERLTLSTVTPKELAADPLPFKWSRLLAPWPEPIRGGLQPYAASLVSRDSPMGRLRVLCSRDVVVLPLYLRQVSMPLGAETVTLGSSRAELPEASIEVHTHRLDRVDLVPQLDTVPELLPRPPYLGPRERIAAALAEPAAGEGGQKAQQDRMADTSLASESVAAVEHRPARMDAFERYAATLAGRRLRRDSKVQAPSYSHLVVCGPGVERHEIAVDYSTTTPGKDWDRHETLHEPLLALQFERPDARTTFDKREAVFRFTTTVPTAIYVGVHLDESGAMRLVGQWSPQVRSSLKITDAGRRALGTIIRLDLATLSARNLIPRREVPAASVPGSPLNLEQVRRVVQIVTETPPSGWDLAGRTAFDVALGLVPIVGDAADIGELLLAASTGRDRWGERVDSLDLALMTVGALAPFVGSRAIREFGDRVVRGAARSETMTAELAEILGRNIDLARRVREWTDAISSGRRLTADATQMARRGSFVDSTVLQLLGPPAT